MPEKANKPRPPRCADCGHSQARHDRMEGKCQASYSAGPSGVHPCGCRAFVMPANLTT